MRTLYCEAGDAGETPMCARHRSPDLRWRANGRSSRKSASRVTCGVRLGSKRAREPRGGSGGSTSKAGRFAATSIDPAHCSRWRLLSPSSRPIISRGICLVLLVAADKLEPIIEPGKRRLEPGMDEIARLDHHDAGKAPIRVAIVQPEQGHRAGVELGRASRDGAAASCLCPTSRGPPIGFSEETALSQLEALII
jgi:hypothetical protein